MGLAADQFSCTNANFSDVEFTVEDGSLTITPVNAAVTIRGRHNVSVYDGAEHSVKGYDVEISNPLYSQDDFEFSGKDEAARTEEGTTEMGLAADQFTNKNENFATVTFDVTDGYQTITAVDEVLVTITGHRSTADYDGEEHAVSGYDVEISDPLYKESDFTFTGKAEASAVHTGTVEMGLAPEQFTNNNNNFSKVTFNVTDGSQTIVPVSAAVRITGNSFLNRSIPRRLVSRSKTARMLFWDLSGKRKTNMKLVSLKSMVRSTLPLFLAPITVSISTIERFGFVSM